MDAPLQHPDRVRVSDADLARFCDAALEAAGADAASAEAATRAMMHASRHGVDSHGVRLLPHYAKVIAGGRVNGRAAPYVARSLGSTAVVDGDDGHGARVMYFAMAHAVALAREHGIGAVAVRRSSHFGAAGAYALAAAEAGMVGLATGNADSIVRLHDGAEPFHGTNPIAFGAPVAGERPWLLDMATSSIPFNRVLLYKSLGVALPEGAASDAEGRDTIDAGAARMLAPVGSAFGFKGAALGGLVEILSAALTGMRLCFEMHPMGDPEVATPRRMGAFVLAMNPTAFVDQPVYDDTMRRYVKAVRGGRAVPGGALMAPGDREWAEAERRARDGIPLDPDTLAEFAAIAAERGLPLPAPL